MSALDIVQMKRQNSDNPLYVYNTNGDRFDISTEPVLDTPDLKNTVEFEKLNREGKAYSRYMFNGVRVPRVTSILSYCEGDTDGLMRYAANLGRRYYEVNKNTLDIGTKVHEAIAEYLTAGTTYCLSNTPYKLRREVDQCLRNFIAWYNNATMNLGWKVEIFISEVPLICPWFAGTADAILIINGKRYIVDFKSSKRISTSYFIQTSAYKWIVDNYYPDYGPIDGLGILRFDKFNDVYEDLFLEMSDPNDTSFITYCQQVFGLALNMFYNMEILNTEFMTIKNDGTHTSNTGKISTSLEKAPVPSRKKKGKNKHVQRVNDRRQ